MPTYEFRCPQGHEFEKFYRSIGSAEAQAVCPECGQPAERVMSAAGFAFKGSGFYLTDYGKNAHRDKGTPEPKAGADGGGDGAKPDAKGDAAPAAPAASTNGTSASTAAKTGAEPKASEPKPAESKTAKPAPKKSAGE